MSFWSETIKSRLRVLFLHPSKNNGIEWMAHTFPSTWNPYGPGVLEFKMWRNESLMEAIKRTERSCNLNMQKNLGVITRTYTQKNNHYTVTYHFLITHPKI